MIIKVIMYIETDENIPDYEDQLESLLCELDHHIDSLIQIESYPVIRNIFGVKSEEDIQEK